MYNKTTSKPGDIRGVHAVQASKDPYNVYTTPVVASHAICKAVDDNANALTGAELVTKVSFKDAAGVDAFEIELDKSIALSNSGALWSALDSKIRSLGYTPSGDYRENMTVQFNTFAGGSFFVLSMLGGFVPRLVTLTTGETIGDSTAVKATKKRCHKYRVSVALTGADFNLVINGNTITIAAADQTSTELIEKRIQQAIFDDATVSAIVPSGADFIQVTADETQTNFDFFADAEVLTTATVAGVNATKLTDSVIAFV
jgi:hypothetical protein